MEGRPIHDPKEKKAFALETVLIPVSLPRRVSKGEKTAEAGSTPHHIPLLAPSVEHIVPSPHMLQEPSGALISRKGQ